MGRLLLVFTFTTSFLVSAQNSQLFFSEALDAHLPAYLLKAEQAIRNLEQDKVKILFDNLVENQLEGSLMDNFKVESITGKSVSLSDYAKPVMLLTYSSWRISSKGEQTALNDLAKNYGDDLNIVLLFWGEYKDVKKLSKGYHRNIDILHVDVNDNKYTQIIKNLKHSFGLPLVYSITTAREIIAIKRRLSNKIEISEEDSALMNHKMYKGMITKLLYEQELLSDSPILLDK